MKFKKKILKTLFLVPVLKFEKKKKIENPKYKSQKF